MSREPSSGQGRSPGPTQALTPAPPWTDGQPPRLPATLGRYRLEELLGKGAMGAVYRAHDTQLDRTVALKIPQFDPRERADLQERFLREARAAAGLHHPHLCPVHDVGEIGGVPYLTMAFIPGQSLEAALKARPVWPVAEAVALVRTVAAAIGHAHRQGVVHRDLKPANILLDAAGRPVVTDFGLAKRAAAADPALTASGALVGSPAYMSPEQARGQGGRAGPAADTYALGVILYELLTGRRPFRGTLADVLSLVLSQAPEPPSRLRPEVDGALEAVVLKCLAKDPGQRFADGHELAEALGAVRAPVRPEGAATESWPAARTPARIPRRPIRRGWWAAGVTFLAALLAALAWRGGGGAPAAPGTPAAPGPAATPSANRLGLQFVWIAPGSFAMGSPDGDPDAGADEKPQHRVTLTKGFFLGTCPVTRGQFARFVAAGGYQTEAEQKPGNLTWRTPGFAQADDHPVVRLSWDDAQALITWLNDQGPGGRFRLPTEAEWEYACRAGARTRYHFGDDPGRLGEFAWYAANSGQHTRPVGQKRPNAWGLYDMHGNVWQWCADWYDPGAYRRGDCTDPRGPTDGAGRVYRGGGWRHPAAECRAAYRGGSDPAKRFDYLGLRLACDPAGP